MGLRHRSRCGDACGIPGNRSANSRSPLQPDQPIKKPPLKGGSVIEQIFVGYIEYFAYIYNFNIGDKTLSAFNPLNSIFINIKTFKLKSVSKLPLGYIEFFSQMCNFCATYVVETFS